LCPLGLTIKLNLIDRKWPDRATRIKKLASVFSCVCPVIDNDFRHNIVKEAVDPHWELKSCVLGGRVNRWNVKSVVGNTIFLNRFSTSYRS